MKALKALSTLVLLLLLAACGLNPPAPGSHSIEGEVLLDTRTPAPPVLFTPTTTLAPYPASPLLSQPTDPESTAAAEEGFWKSLTNLIRDEETTAIQPATAVYTDVTATRSGSIHQMAWASDGGLIAAGTSVGIFLYDAATLEKVQSLNIGEPVSSVLFSPNLGMLVSGGLDGDIHWQDIHTGTELASFSGHLLGIADLAISFLGDYLISASDDGSAQLWLTRDVLDSSVQAYAPVQVWKTAKRLTCVDLRSDSQLAAAGGFETVLVWDAASAENIFTVEGLSGWVNDLAFSPDGSRLAVIDSSNRLRLWDTTTWQTTQDFSIEQTDQLTALAFSLFGDSLAIGGSDGTIFLWHLAEDTIESLPGIDQAVTSLAFSPGGERLISSYQNGLWRMWQLP